MTGLPGHIAGLVGLLAIASACSFDRSADLAASSDANPGSDAGGSEDAAQQAALVCDASKSDLVLCMRFEESGASTTLTDESQYGNHAEVGNATFVVGLDGLSLQSFNGFDSKIAESESLDVTSAITMEMWIRPDQDQDAGRWGLFDNNGQYGFFLHDGNQLRCTSGGPTVSTGDDAVVPRVWQHVACTYDGSSARIYVNGQLAGAEEGSGDFNTNGNEGSAIAQDSPDGDEFLGRIDTLRVWSTGLSQESICALAGLSCPERVPARARRHRALKYPNLWLRA